jgi:DNA-binding NarL/FixJ family response regulator
MIRVLLADDHATVRDGLRLVIDAQPDMAVVGEAAEGQSAIEQTRALRPHVLVLDLTMPGIGGLAVARAVAIDAPASRVVVLTRHADAAYMDELRAAGAAAYVLKQSPSSHLLQAIRAVAAGSTWLDPAISGRDESPKKRFAPLVTNRESEVLRRTAIGESNKEIAAAMHIKVKTVEVHKANAMRKLGFQGRADVVRYAILQGWLRDP